MNSHAPWPIQEAGLDVSNRDTCSAAKDIDALARMMSEQGQQQQYSQNPVPGGLGYQIPGNMSEYWRQMLMFNALQGTPASSTVPGPSFPSLPGIAMPPFPMPAVGNAGNLSGAASLQHPSTDLNRSQHAFVPGSPQTNSAATSRSAGNHGVNVGSVSQQMGSTSAQYPMNNTAPSLHPVLRGFDALPMQQHLHGSLSSELTSTVMPSLPPIQTTDHSMHSALASMQNALAQLPSAPMAAQHSQHAQHQPSPTGHLDMKQMLDAMSAAAGFASLQQHQPQHQQQHTQSGTMPFGSPGALLHALTLLPGLNQANNSAPYGNSLFNPWAGLAAFAQMGQHSTAGNAVGNPLQALFAMQAALAGMPFATPSFTGTGTPSFIGTGSLGNAGSLNHASMTPGGGCALAQAALAAGYGGNPVGGVLEAGAQDLSSTMQVDTHDQMLLISPMQQFGTANAVNMVKQESIGDLGMASVPDNAGVHAGNPVDVVEDGGGSRKRAAPGPAVGSGGAVRARRTSQEAHRALLNHSGVSLEGAPSALQLSEHQDEEAMQSSDECGEEQEDSTDDYSSSDNNSQHAQHGPDGSYLVQPGNTAATPFSLIPAGPTGLTSLHASNVGSMALSGLPPMSILPKDNYPVPGFGTMSAHPVPMSHPVVMRSGERENKQEKRKQSNRESARRSRIRKQQELADVHTVVEKYREENPRLQAQVMAMNKNAEQLDAQNTILRELLEVVKAHVVSNPGSPLPADRLEMYLSKLHSCMYLESSPPAVRINRGTRRRQSEQGRPHAQHASDEGKAGAARHDLPAQHGEHTEAARTGLKKKTSRALKGRGQRDTGDDVLVIAPPPPPPASTTPSPAVNALLSASNAGPSTLSGQIAPGILPDVPSPLQSHCNAMAPDVMSGGHTTAPGGDVAGLPATEVAAVAADVLVENAVQPAWREEAQVQSRYVNIRQLSPTDATDPAVVTHSGSSFLQYVGRKDVGMAGSGQQRQRHAMSGDHLAGLGRLPAQPQFPGHANAAPQRANSFNFLTHTSGQPVKSSMSTGSGAAGMPHLLGIPASEYVSRQKAAAAMEAIAAAKAAAASEYSGQFCGSGSMYLNMASPGTTVTDTDSELPGHRLDDVGDAHDEQNSYDVLAAEMLDDALPGSDRAVNIALVGPSTRDACGGGASSADASQQVLHLTAQAGLLGVLTNAAARHETKSPAPADLPNIEPSPLGLGKQMYPISDYGVTTETQQVEAADHKDRSTSEGAENTVRHVNPAQEAQGRADVQGNAPGHAAATPAVRRPAPRPQPTSRLASCSFTTPKAID